MQPNLYRQFKRFIKEKDIYGQSVQFARPEFERDFKKYTEKTAVYSPYGVARLYAGKLPSRRGDEKDRPLSSFLDEWNKADGKQKAEL